MGVTSEAETRRKAAKEQEENAQADRDNTASIEIKKTVIVVIKS